MNYALCCPSRATLLTGQYAHNHGVLSNQLPSGGYTRLDRSNWLPGWLQASGYHTIHVGKFLNGYGVGNQTEVPPGWSEWYGTVDPSTYSFYNYTVNENGTLVTYGADGDEAFYSTDFFSRRAAEAVTRLAPSDQPFFLSLAYLAPHGGQPRENDDPPNLGTPAVAPRHHDVFAAEPFPFSPAFNEADVSDKPQRISGRRVLPPGAHPGDPGGLPPAARVPAGGGRGRSGRSSTRSSAAGRSTTRWWCSPPTTASSTASTGSGPARRCPTSRPSACRCSCAARAFPAGLRLNQLVTNADLAQTIVDAAGVTPGRIQDGRSLLDLTEDPGLWWGRELLIEGGDRNGLTFAGLRNYRYSYVEYGTGERELYDLNSDPDQLVSHHSDPNYASVQAGLAQRLAALRACAGASCRMEPRLALRLRGRRCRGRALRARVTGGEERRVDLVRFYTRGRARGSDRRAPFMQRLRIRGRSPVQLRVRVATDDGRVVTLDRRLRGCG